MRARIAAGSAGALCVVALAFSSGGYFPSEWGLITLAFLLMLLAAVGLADRVALGVAAIALLVALASLALWELASVLWSGGAGLPVTEAQRTLLYLVAAAAILACLAPATVPALLQGITAGITVVAIYALGTRLAPGLLGGAYDPSSGYQLAKPIGYWNALGLLVVFGLVLAAGITMHRDALAGSVAAAAGVPLLACLYFTFSRGALVALGVALFVLVALDGDRFRAAVLLAVFLVFPLAAVVLAGRSEALTVAGATLQTAQREGHRLAWQLVVLAVLAASAQVGSRWLMSRVRVGRSLRRGAAFGLAAAIVLIALVGIGRAGGPTAIVEQAQDSFVEEPPATSRGLDRRLLSASGNGRSEYWRVAARTIGRDPLLGGGAGSFARLWAKERPVPNEARDAHNLYLETLAELGPVGLALLLVVCAAPLVALRRVWRDPAAPAATAVLIAFLVHAAVDWDWEIPVLSLVALSCGAVLLVLDPRKCVVALGAARRGAAVAVIGLLLVVSLVAHVGNRAAAAAADALVADDSERAAAAAERVRTWIPWSTQGDQLLGEALAEAGDVEGAREVLREAAGRDPGEWSIWYDLAAVSVGAERVRAITRASELNPLSDEVAALRAENQTDSS